MSTTLTDQSARYRRRPPGLDPETTPAADVFPDYVVDNDDLCPRCFRQQYDVEVLSEQLVADHGDVLASRVVALHDGTEETVEHQDLARTPEWTHRDYVPPRDGVPERRERTTCNCGDIDGAELRTRTKNQAIDHAANLSAVLDRWGLANDWVVLLRQVKLAKETPRYTADDGLCFDLGVTHAIRKARELDPRPALAAVLDRHR